MEWKYRKDVKVLPGITLKYGKGGVSTSLEFQSKQDEFDYKSELEKLRNTLYKPYNASEEIKSKSIEQLTSNGLLQFKDLLIHSHSENKELQLLLDGKNQELIAKRKTSLQLEKSLFRYFYKKKRVRISEEIENISNEISELEEQIPYSIISLEIDSEETFQELYDLIIKAYHLLLFSQKKWDVTSSKRTNMIAERTSASDTITRTEIAISLKTLNLIKCGHTPICFQNANGGNLYFYPGFLVLHENNRDFALIDYNEIEIGYKLQRFIEEQQVPSDTTIVDHTWHKVNKDGSPDRRFSNNYQIPIVLYGEIHFHSQSGLNEKYSFSNAEAAELFVSAFNNYIQSLKTAKNLLDEFNK